MSSVAGAKKAVHVKWAGKTIALGTFLVNEADEKCARAKALTRAWRSTMRPKPTREWVMLELERLNVRVVSGRSAKDDEYADENDPVSMGMRNAPHNADPNMVGRRGSITASLLNAADMARGNGAAAGAGADWQNGGQMNNLAFNPNMMQRSNSTSLSTSLLGDSTRLQDDTKSAPPHRPLVGGGSAAAYEAARADHYRELAEKKSKDHDHDRGGGEMVRADPAGGAISNLAGSMGKNGAMTNGGGGVLGGLSINANQHYDMLKLHHMNLLNEIQETTLMMNIYQQQQLQQQQQQQEEMEIHHMQDDQYSNDMSQQHGTHGNGHNIRSANGGSDRPNEIPHNHEGEPAPKPSSSSVPKTIRQNNHGSSHDDKNREDQLAKIKAEIEDRKRMLEKLGAGTEPTSKRSKTS